MNQTKNKTANSRLPEISTIILLVLAIGYYFYSSNGSTNTGSSSFIVSTDTTTVGADVLNLLNQINSLKIDTSMFQSPTYQSLTDFSVIVPPEPIGKSNPFLPIGISGGVATSTN